MAGHRNQRHQIEQRVLLRVFNKFGDTVHLTRFGIYRLHFLVHKVVGLIHSAVERKLHSEHRATTFVFAEVYLAVVQRCKLTYQV